MRETHISHEDSSYMRINLNSGDSVLTMFKFGQHGLFSINRSTLANQKTLGQVLLVKSFKHILSCMQRYKKSHQRIQMHHGIDH